MTPSEVTSGVAPEQSSGRPDLRKYAWMSIAAAVATIALKTTAWWITGSVGLLSDAAESLVNLVAAIVALIALTVSMRPVDRSHQYGHSKAEYFSAAVEGQMIFVAAVVILWTSVDRFLHPAPLENVGIGLLVSVAASALNGIVAMVLMRAGRAHRSLTLTADGRHLLTDVWTSVGVVVGVLIVAVTGIERLDPVVAFLVGLNIIWTGFQLLRESVNGLMDQSLSKEENAKVAAALHTFVTDQVTFHGLRTREAGHRQFAEVHMLVPGAWSVQRSHDLVEHVEAALRQEFDSLEVTVHVEPSEDPRSYEEGVAEVPVRPYPDDAGTIAGNPAVVPGPPA